MRVRPQQVGELCPQFGSSALMNVVFQEYQDIQTTFKCQDKLRKNGWRSHKQSCSTVHFNDTRVPNAGGKLNCYLAMPSLKEIALDSSSDRYSPSQTVEVRRWHIYIALP